MSCFIIAEAGVNHNGDLDLARRLIDAAAEAGADAVKFQTFRAAEIASPAAQRARYQNPSADNGGQLEMLKALELSEEDHLELSRHATERSIRFSSTAFDPAGVDLLDRLQVPFFKIPSGEITNYPLVRHIAARNRPVILSTGMSTLDEVRTAVGWLGDGPQAYGALPALTVLHCVSAYPAPAEDINLGCVASLARDLNLPTGYSDHSLGLEMPVAAVALGATVIEKHFTLNRDLEGPDHRASLEPDELKEMVAAIRRVERAMGDGVKKPAPSELENIEPVRRGIVASRRIEAGETFSDENIAVRRPARGIPAAEWTSVIGREAHRGFDENEPIELR